MEFVKRGLTYIFIILFIASIMNDLKIREDNSISSQTTLSIEDNHSNYVIYKVKIDTGDTVLSIVEELNKSTMSDNVDLHQVMNDFHKLNPDVDPYQIQPHNYYYFPVYKKRDQP